ncbi:unnamed protein product, partial [Amoebophrya sp. A25]
VYEVPFYLRSQSAWIPILIDDRSPVPADPNPDFGRFIQVDTQQSPTLDLLTKAFAKLEGTFLRPL